METEVAGQFHGYRMRAEGCLSAAATHQLLPLNATRLRARLRKRARTFCARRPLVHRTYQETQRKRAVSSAWAGASATTIEHKFEGDSTLLGSADLRAYAFRNVARRSLRKWDSSRSKRARRMSKQVEQ